MDPFEEFEFKPLTDGLGFHKKKSSSQPKAETKLDSFAKTRTEPGLNLIEEPGLDPLRSPLPRKKSASTATALTPLPTAPSSLISEDTESDSSKAVDEILKTLQKNRRFEIEKNQTAFIQKSEKPKEQYKASFWNISAAILDAMLVIAASLLCMIIMLVITKADLMANLSNPDVDGMVYVATFAVVGTVTFIYLSINRIYLGWTPGEWAFDQRIGKPEEINQTYYPLKIAARSLLVIMTGFILFPLLSLALKEDLAGAITGARIYKKG